MGVDPFQRFVFPVLAYSVLDGDSVRVTLDRGWRDTLQLVCRLHGIDAPPKDERAGSLCRDCTERWLSKIDAGDLFAVSHGQGKYSGRFLGELHDWRTEEGLAKWLLRNGLVRPYDGGTKEPWRESDLRTICRRAMAIL